MTRAQLHQLGGRLRALGSTRGDWLAYIDGTLPLLTMAFAAAPKSDPKIKLEGCPICAERRRRKARAQKNWRKKAKTK